MIVRVYNDNKYEHREEFRDEDIIIPAGGYIEMEREDAVLFLGQLFTPKFSKHGLQTDRSKKKLRIDETVVRPGAKPEKAGETFKCQACNKDFKSKAGLQSHIRTHHKHLMVDDDAREELENVS